MHRTNLHQLKNNHFKLLFTHHQWYNIHHDAFFEALQLELYDHKNDLDFIFEHPLSKEALIMDVLVIKKKPGVQISKNIGRIFETHNIFEYKSESDYLSKNDYNKVIAYALLYSSFTPADVSDITVSFAVTSHPRELLKYLTTDRGFTIQTADPGIYYVQGDTFPIQILEGKKLSQDENLFLQNLRSNLTAADISKAVEAYRKLKSFEKKNAYMDRLVKANPRIAKEAMNMSEAAINIILEGADEYGWLDDRYLAKAKTIAKNLLLIGRPIDEVAQATDLPYDVVAGLLEE